MSYFNESDPSPYYWESEDSVTVYEDNSTVMDDDSED